MEKVLSLITNNIGYLNSSDQKFEWFKKSIKVTSSSNLGIKCRRINIGAEVKSSGFNSGIQCGSVVADINGIVVTCETYESITERIIKSKGRPINLRLIHNNKSVYDAIIFDSILPFELCPAIELAQINVVNDNSMASNYGVKVGDIILSINNNQDQLSDYNSIEEILLNSSESKSETEVIFVMICGPRALSETKYLEKIDNYENNVDKLRSLLCNSGTPAITYLHDGSVQIIGMISIASHLTYSAIFNKSSIYDHNINDTLLLFRWKKSDALLHAITFIVYNDTNHININTSSSPKYKSKNRDYTKKNLFERNHYRILKYMSATSMQKSLPLLIQFLCCSGNLRKISCWPLDSSSQTPLQSPSGNNNSSFFSPIPQYSPNKSLNNNEIDWTTTGTEFSEDADAERRSRQGLLQYIIESCIGRNDNKIFFKLYWKLRSSSEAILNTTTTSTTNIYDEILKDLVDLLLVNPKDYYLIQLLLQDKIPITYNQKAKVELNDNDVDDDEFNNNSIWRDVSDIEAYMIDTPDHDNIANNNRRSRANSEFSFTSNDSIESNQLQDDEDWLYRRLSSSTPLKTNGARARQVAEMIARQVVFFDALREGLDNFHSNSNGNKKLAERMKYLPSTLNSILNNAEDRWQAGKISGFDAGSLWPIHSPITDDVLVQLNIDKCRFLRSSHYPLLLCFKTHIGCKEEYGEVKLLYKFDDDVRQDELMLFLFDLLDNNESIESNHFSMVHYKAISLGWRHGLIEWIDDACPFSEIVSLYNLYSSENNPLQVYLRTANPSQNDLFGINPKLMENLVKTSATATVLTYIFSIGDRHLDNLLLRSNGSFMHCDFGYIFGKNPTFSAVKTDVRFPRELMQAMGGVNCALFQKCLKFIGDIYLNIRKQSSFIMNTLWAMSASDLNDIISLDAIKGVNDRLKLELNDEDARNHILKVLDDALQAIMPNLMQKIHEIAIIFK